MNRFVSLRWLVLWLPSLLLLSGCFTFRDHGELYEPPYVDLAQVTQGMWYVEGYLPTAADPHTHNATFEFNQRRDGSLRIIYAYNNGAFDGPLRNREFKATIKDITTNAEWRMQVIWPFAADLRVLYVDDAYETMIIGHPSRRYLYILTREAGMDEAAYQWLLDFVASQGYHTAYLRRVPHQ